ncbi:hypothetical protein [Arenivirga flava]|uniref:Haemin-degrading HemS/ChuX domain-containing protein n=1 Tax=Arenivirga flava TaxID=1930060 RepID=A0AA37X9X6_9MICO|nr:hypothetical protein [Arenivirga flava]GMA26836.1 hypothetical protein GCM10025874_00890 [Arenivirga flava]
MSAQGDPGSGERSAGSLPDDGAPCGPQDGCGRCASGHGGTPIDASAPEVAATLPVLESSLATTWTEGVAIAQAGAYSSVTRTGTAFAVPPGRIALRLDPSTVVGAVLDEHRGGDPVLELVTGSGRPVHRLRSQTPVDHLVLRSLAREHPGPAAALAGALLDDWTPSPGSAEWPGDDQLSRLDDALAGVGRSPVEHRHIDLRLLPEVLGHLCSTGLPFGAAVLGDGVAQACAGALQAVSADDGRLGVVFQDASLDLDATALGGCVLVRTAGVHGPTSALELVDRRGRRVAMLTQFGLVGAATHRAWEDLAEALPSLG